MKLQEDYLLCSPLDQFSKATGRAKSLGRAIKALVRKETNCSIQYKRLLDRYNFGNEHLSDIHEAYNFFGWKSMYNPTLTEFEQRIINNRNNEIKNVINGS
jgi:hypothetical protein